MSAEVTEVSLEKNLTDNVLNCIRDGVGRSHSRAGGGTPYHLCKSISAKLKKLDWSNSWSPVLVNWD